jgi:hypothetical protein
VQIMDNTDGPLPGDIRHSIKIFGAKDWLIGSQHRIGTGVALHGNSGGPTSYRGSYQYRSGYAFYLPRGSGERLPWVFGSDLQLGYSYFIDKQKSIGITMDIFNLFNFQSGTSRDEKYATNSDTRALCNKGEGLPACQGGTLADLATHTDVNGDPLKKNPNFGNINGYQAPRVIRFGIRGEF